MAESWTWLPKKKKWDVAYPSILECDVHTLQVSSGTPSFHSPVSFCRIHDLTFRVEITTYGVTPGERAQRIIAILSPPLPRFFSLMSLSTCW
jgi:hypothetical protein